MAVPAALMWTSWVPLVVAAALILAFCTVYVMYYKSVLSGEQSSVASAAATLALAVTLVATAIVPVDVFLVSMMKYDNGTYKPWADAPEARASVEEAVSAAYYLAYGTAFAFAFLVLPLIFFYHVGRCSVRGGTDEEEEELGDKLSCLFEMYLNCNQHFD